MTSIEDIYIMYYRHGMNSALTKFFTIAGGLPAAKMRAHDFCKIMNYKLLNVTPLLSDLKSEEDTQMGVVNTTPDTGRLVPAPLAQAK